MARADNINTGALTWARETAGLTTDEAAGRLGISHDRLVELESGETSPTRVQLLKLAAVYRRPLTTFYMSSVPREAPRGEDFRTLPGPVSRKDSGALDALLRDIRARQDMVKAIVELEDPDRRIEIVGSVSDQEPVEDVAERVRLYLGFTSDRETIRFSGAPELFRDLRKRVEERGIFVLLAGDLGSYQSAISEEVFRGFTIADPVAPFIVINDKDAKPAYAFTLVHELVHIFVGTSGVSSAPSSSNAKPATREARIERFCNDVASEVLLPSAYLPVIGADGDETVIGATAREWNVSEPLVAYRLHRTGRLSDRRYGELVAIYSGRWKSTKENRKEGPADGGPSYYVLKRYRLGDALLSLVHRQVRGESLTHTKAAKVLGVRPPNVERLLRSIEQPRRLSRG